MINPTVPSPLTVTPSYNCCAALIVRLLLKEILFPASCCNKLVVNGLGAERFFSLESILSISISFLCKSFNTNFVSSSECSSIFLLFFSVSLNTAFLLSSPVTVASIVQYSSGVKARISSSLSTINLVLTLCTLPALSPFLTFIQRIGLILYPTNLSMIRRACCASTKSKSIFRGDLIAFLMASFVISLKVIRLLSLISKPSKYAKCHEIASPSRSWSVAR